MPTQTAKSHDIARNVYRICRFCGAPVEAGRLICAPEQASECIDRQNREAAAMSRKTEAA